MSIRAVFFDLDDTLILTTATRTQRARLSAEALLPHARSMSIDSLASRMLAPTPRVSRSEPHPLIEELNIAGTEAAASAIGIWFFRRCEHLIRGPNGAERVVRALSTDHTLGVISNGDPDIQANKLGALPFSHHFAASLRVFSGAIGHAKPDPCIFQHALEGAGVEPREAVMVGDWALGDVGGAQAAGLSGVWFNPDGSNAPDGVSPDATIRGMDELPGLLREWDT